METKLKMEGFVEVTQDDLLAINGGWWDGAEGDQSSHTSTISGGGTGKGPVPETCCCGTLTKRP